MKQWLRKRWRLLLIAAIALPLLAYGGLFVIGIFNLFHAHEHCSKIAGSAFSLYASDHAGKYPSHTNGFGDALLVLLKDRYTDVRFVTAPGDDGRVLTECLEKGLDVPEDKCSRVYLQGLSEDDMNGGVVIMFDRYPTPGGDHFRRPWGTPMRDAVMCGGWVEFITEERWPAFAKEQIERLVELGFKRTELDKLFGVQSKSSAGVRSAK